MPLRSPCSPWTTLVFISFGMMTTGLLWLSMPPMVLPISRQLNMSGAQVAIWVSTPLWIFVFFSLPMGIMADRWNLKYISGIGLSFIAAFATARSFVESYAGLMVVTILFSTGYTIYFPCVPKIISKIFTPKKIATASGIYLASFGLGAAVGVSLSQPLFGSNWHKSFLMSGILSILVAILWWTSVKDSWSGRKVETKLETNPSSHKSQWKGVKKVFRVKTVWLITAIFFAYIGARSCWVSFGFPYLVTMKGIKETMAGYIMMMDNLGYITGSMIVPYFSDRVGLRRPILLYFSLLFSLLLLVFTKLPGGPTLWMMPYLIGLSFGAINPLVYVMASESKDIGSEYVGVAVGVILTVGNLAGLLLPTIMGKIIGTLETATSWQYQISWIGLAIFTGGMIFASGLMIEETGYRAKPLR